MENYYQFTAQDVFTLPSTSDVLWAAPDKLLVSSSDANLIRVFDLGDKGRLTHQLPTQNLVGYLEYCAFNNHIMTLEENALYIYQMWWTDQVRIKTLGMAYCATWCQNTGRLGVFDGDKLIIYQDLLPLFEITGVYDVTKVVMCENIVFLQTCQFAIVLSTDEAKYNTPDREVIWNFDCDELIVNGDTLSSAGKAERNQFSDIPEELDEVYHPDRPIFGLNLRQRSLHTDRIYEPQVLLFRRGCPSFCHLIPYYVSTNEPVHDPLAASRGHLQCVNLILAEADQCNIYSMYGAQGELYQSFPSKAESIAVDECFLHVLTSQELLTFGVPIPDLSENWQLVDVSKHTMLYMSKLMMSRDQLVVVSGRQEGSAPTVYSLLKPTTSEFFSDMLHAEPPLDVLEHAKNVVRLQVRIHGENACSQRLLDLYQNMDQGGRREGVEELLEAKTRSSKEVRDAVQNTEIGLLIADSGSLTEMGDRLVEAYPESVAVLLTLGNYLSPKTLRSVIANASPNVAKSICAYVCQRLGRVDSGKIHRKLLQSSIPAWCYELPPFLGKTPDVHCNLTEDVTTCTCLRCSSGLLYAVSVLSNAPRNIRFEQIFPSFDDQTPDLLRLACLLPMSRSSGTHPRDYEGVADSIVSLVEKYSKEETSAERAPHLLTVLSDVLRLEDFLRCVPNNDAKLVPWVKNGLMRKRAEKLKIEIIQLGDELRPLLP